MTLKVRVVAYAGKIVIVPEKPEEGIDDEWWPTGGGKGGCVLGDTKNRLGVSDEALTLMAQVKLNRDAVGDLSWWQCVDEEGKNSDFAFSWWGPIYRVVDPEDSEAARDFHIYQDECVRIPNEVPAEAKQALDLKPDTVAWNTPHEIEPYPECKDDYKDEPDPIEPGEPTVNT